MNAVLGFDTYLVMIHGARASSTPTTTTTAMRGNWLGCYYCNYIVVPADVCPLLTLLVIILLLTRSTVTHRSNARSNMYSRATAPKSLRNRRLLNVISCIQRTGATSRKLMGLDKLHDECEAALEIVDWDDDDDDDEGCWKEFEMYRYWIVWLFGCCT